MKTITSLFLLSGKPSKKSKLTYRVRLGRQQCYILNHSTPNSKKQIACQNIFGQVSKIVNRIMAIPAQKAHWEHIAQQSNTPNFSARKAAYAHYKQIIITKNKTQKFIPHNKPHLHNQDQNIFNIISFVAHTLVKSHPLTHTTSPNNNIHQQKYRNLYKKLQVQSQTKQKY